MPTWYVSFPFVYTPCGYIHQLCVHLPVLGFQHVVVGPLNGLWTVAVGCRNQRWCAAQMLSESSDGVMLVDVRGLVSWLVVYYWKSPMDRGGMISEVLNCRMTMVFDYLLQYILND